MHVLLLSPQPFLVDRGTPIAVRAVVTTLCENGHTVDLASFHGGRDVSIRGMRHFRIGQPPLVGNVPIGLSCQKLVCNLWLLALAFRLLRRGRYDCIHAVEDSVFLALLLRRFAPVPVIYDMDSIMSDQIAEKWPALARLARGLRRIERVAMRASDLIICVCPALASRAADDAPATAQVVLHDYPLWNDGAGAPSIRTGGDPGRLVALYVGNLQPYQGVDLLTDAVRLLPAGLKLDLVIVGGLPEDAGRAVERSARDESGIRIRFLGPMPLEWLPGLVLQGDILLSPRRQGVNTPMKIYTYMMAARAILATSIPSHTQVLDESCALLVSPTAAAIAAGLEHLAVDPGRRERLGTAARHKAETCYSKARYDAILLGAYDRLHLPTSGTLCTHPD
ncbi:MAG: glycosyltransferase [Acetobacteraceae bacterium]|nr:glycosyltransferase [Acetobacteraceae bacterium]